MQKIKGDYFCIHVALRRDNFAPSAALEHFHQFCSRPVYCIGLCRRQAASK